MIELNDKRWQILTGEEIYQNKNYDFYFPNILFYLSVKTVKSAKNWFVFEVTVISWETEKFGSLYWFWRPEVDLAS